MNRKAIDKALEAYVEEADEQSLARLEFFDGLWRIQEEEGAAIAQSFTYEVPDAAEVEEHYWSGKAVLADYPAEIATADFARTCNRIAEHLADHAGLEVAIADALRKVNWAEFAKMADLNLAGKNPPEFVEQSLQGFEVFGVPSELPASVFMMVPAWALRAYLDAPASAIMAKMDYHAEIGNVHDQPLHCPVCGTPATASKVGEISSTNGGGRELYCSTCGTLWPFERIRCARCGTTNPNHLHWFHIEGDDAHRMHHCSECMSYTRTVFEDDSPSSLTSMEVEDVVMVKLDAMAHDERFALKSS